LKIRLLDRYQSIASGLIAALLLSGCGVEQGAPSFTLFGAFFPAWMFCSVIGIIIAIGARGIFVSIGGSALLPYQLAVCTSIGVIGGALAWLFWFGS
jgi:hypothetical protein